MYVLLVQLAKFWKAFPLRLKHYIGLSCCFELKGIPNSCMQGFDSAATLSIMTLSITALSIMTFSIMENKMRCSA